MRTKRIYSKEYKIEAVNLANELGDVKAASESLGIDGSMLRRWRREAHHLSEEDAFIGTGKSKTKTADQQELLDLRKQLRDVTMERDILKKAVHIFAKNDR